jgi:hypothetical protein
MTPYGSAFRLVEERPFEEADSVKIKTLAAATCLLAGVWTAATADAATITLSTPLTGATTQPFVDLTVSFDANGNQATNLTGWELYVAFEGLVPDDASFALGDIFQPFSIDVIELHGTCADGAPCSTPPADPGSSQQWVSLASVFAPHLPQGPGTLFTMRFAVDPSASVWSLNVFGESAAATDGCGASNALLWEHPTDGPCAILPFLIVPEDAAVADGIAHVGVSATTPTPTPIPEPTTIVLVSAGLATLVARRRSR